MWDVSNVLEATFQKGDFEPHTLSIEVEDVPGVLNQVSSTAPHLNILWCRLNAEYGPANLIVPPDESRALLMSAAKSA